MRLLSSWKYPEEANEVSDLLRKSQRWRDEYNSLLETHEHLKGLTFEEPIDAVLRQLWKSPYSHYAHSAALLMIIGGVLFLCGFGFLIVVSSGSEGWQVKVPFVAISVGAATMLFLKIRERIATYQADPYKEVQR
jgi:hypothetical protein